MQNGSALLKRKETKLLFDEQQSWIVMSRKTGAHNRKRKRKSESGGVVGTIGQLYNDFNVNIASEVAPKISQLNGGLVSIGGAQSRRGHQQKAVWLAHGTVATGVVFTESFY